MEGAGEPRTPAFARPAFRSLRGQEEGVEEASLCSPPPRGLYSLTQRRSHRSGLPGLGSPPGIFPSRGGKGNMLSATSWVLVLGASLACFQSATPTSTWGQRQARLVSRLGSLATSQAGLGSQWTVYRRPELKPLENDAEQKNCPRDSELDRALAVCMAIDAHWNVKSFSDIKGHANENGAYMHPNQMYDATGQGRWFIEEQHYGFLFIQAGLAFNNSKAIDMGIKIFDWGLRHQEPNGSFNCPDRYHSSGFFLESLARGALLLRSSPFGQAREKWIRRAARHLARLADWFLHPSTVAFYFPHERQHTHRKYLMGSALGLTGALTRNKTLVENAWEYVQQGMKQMDPSGFNFEHRGHDCSYQGLGLMFAARFFLHVASPDWQEEMLPMARKGADWLLSRVGPDGGLNSTGNTRTGTGELNRNGRVKGQAKKEIIQALLYWGWILGRRDLVEAAWLVERERTKKEHRMCPCRLDDEGEWLRLNISRCKRGLCGNKERRRRRMQEHIRPM